jgi:hypothetical protein
MLSEFPHDAITEISKGVRGADCIQEVFTPGGHCCGKILWESKRTKNWSNAWVDKLKEDQREAKADIAAIISQAVQLKPSVGQIRQIRWRGGCELD